MNSLITAQQLHTASGEELLLMSVFGNPANQVLIDQELDRRARCGESRRFDGRDRSTRSRFGAPALAA